MSDFGLGISIGLGVASLLAAFWAIRISLKGNSLLLTLAKSIQTMEVRNKRRKNVVSETTKLREIALKEQSEQRKAVELELKKQQQDWRKKKDVAKLIKWFIDNLEDDDE